MTDWIIVALDMVIVLETFGIGLWYSSDFTDTRLRLLALAFFIITGGLILFAFFRDLVLALGYENQHSWFFLRHNTILPWRLSMAIAFGIMLAVLRFGKWSDRD